MCPSLAGNGRAVRKQNKSPRGSEHVKHHGTKRKGYPTLLRGNWNLWEDNLFPELQKERSLKSSSRETEKVARYISWEAGRPPRGSEFMESQNGPNADPQWKSREEEQCRKGTEMEANNPRQVGGISHILWPQRDDRFAWQKQGYELREKPVTG